MCRTNPPIVSQVEVLPGVFKMIEEKAPAAIEVKAAVQNYEWGVRGGANNGLVARMANAPPSEGIPFAELWMGTHPKAPLSIIDANNSAAPGTPLSEFLQANPAFAGEKSVATYAEQLPYLFKCLSVDKALSIQAHPDKKLAQQLHFNDAKNYPDTNHKPELACAVTDFEGLCGFRPLAELSEFLTLCPELRVLVGDDLALEVAAAVTQTEAAAHGAALKKAFAALMNSDADAIQTLADAMAKRLQEKDPAALSATERLILRINGQFPGDVGLFNIMFLNHCVLAPGQAMFLGPNLPHAYISGDCMEIMATSDNVVRAGFTPKFKDVKTLVGMLDYTCGKAPVLEGEAEHAGAVRLYKAPGSEVPEFALRQVKLESTQVVSLGSSVAPRTVICVSGGPIRLKADASHLASCVRDLKMSSVVVVGAGSSLELSLPEGSDTPALVFVASCHPCFE